MSTYPGDGDTAPCWCGAVAPCYECEAWLRGVLGTFRFPWLRVTP